MFKLPVSLFKKIRFSLFVVVLGSLFLVTSVSAKVIGPDDEGFHGYFPPCPSNMPFYNHQTGQCEVMLTQAYCASLNMELWGYHNVCRDPECEDGYSWDGSKCVQDITCPSGSSWDGSQCVPDAPSCPIHSHWNGSECICDDGYFGEGGICFPDTQ